MGRGRESIISNASHPVIFKEVRLLQLVILVIDFILGHLSSVRLDRVRGRGGKSSI